MLKIGFGPGDKNVATDFLPIGNSQLAATISW